MADVPQLLLASLSPATRKQAEQTLSSLSVQPGFLTGLLQLVLTPGQDRSVRLAGSVYLKNTIKRRWEEEEPVIPEQEKAQIRAQLVPAMITLSGPTDKSLRAQVAETVSVVAKHDFPENWSDLIDQLVGSLSPSPSAYATNLSVLETAHSIFAGWRSEIRSNELYIVINYVLSRFVEPFLQIFRYTANLLLGTTPPPTAEALVMAQTQDVLFSIFYDLTCQDLPPTLEDAHPEFFSEPDGWFPRFLQWDPANLRGDPDEATPSVPTQIKTHIFEIAELYTHRYPELLLASSSVQVFVRILWSLIGSGQCSGQAYDGLVSQSLRFMSTAIRSGSYREIFESQETISSLVEGVVVPNIVLREHEIEQFEDDPLEYIRLDLSIATTSSAGASGGLSPGADGTTRRQAAADVVRALVASGSEAATTEVAGGWIQKGLQAYATASEAEKLENAWKSKDSAVYLLTAVATRGATATARVTSTNALVDVVKFFSDHVFQDLQADAIAVHPILQVDAIRFLYSFRNQLTKEQLLSVLPLLLRHLGSTNYVCYSYAAITIERILFIKQGNQLLFAQADVRDIAQSIIDAVLTKIEAAGTPEKIAENDYLMKCAMRVILTARQALTPSFERLLTRLVSILGAISKNPSNPNFDQYIFESISALIRFIVSGNARTLPIFEQALFGPITVILQQDIEPFVPYVIQILAQMLELHESTFPTMYRSMLPILLQPASWQQRGSIPALVRLLRAFLKRDGAQMAASGQFTNVLAVVQQKLIPSKLNDMYGFELLQAIVRYIPAASLQPYMKSVVTMLLTRLQTSKTDKYTYSFVYFIAYTMAIAAPGLGPDFMVGAVEQVQPQLWSQLLPSVILPEITKLLPKDRKVAIVGLTRLLTESSMMMTEPSVNQWPSTLTALIKLFTQFQHLKSAQSTEAEDPDEVLRSLDFEDAAAGGSGAGYQAAYSKLAASEAPAEDPVSHVSDAKEFVSKALSSKVRADPSGRVRRLVGAAEPQVVGPFIAALASAGHVL